jgi:hypothetical protein
MKAFRHLYKERRRPLVSAADRMSPLQSVITIGLLSVLFWAAIATAAVKIWALL